jgi:hypothetical protein
MEGESSESERREITAHLQGCPTCQTEAERYRKLERYLNSLTEVNPPVNMAPNLMASFLKNEFGNKKRLIAVFQALTVFMGIFSLPFFTVLLSKIFMASPQTFQFSLNDKGFFIKLILLIAKTLSSLLNDSPLFFDARIPLPALQLLPYLLVAFGVLITVTFILSSLLFSFTLPKNYIPAEK